MPFLPRRLALVTGALLMLGALGACGDDESTPAESNSSAPSDSGETGDTNGIEDNGRAFNSTDDAVITAVTTALTDAEDAQWEGSTLVVTMKSASISDPTSPGLCTAVNAVIADDESGRLVFNDGTIDCEDPHAHLK